jgi:proton glutamate symport protein
MLRIKLHWQIVIAFIVAILIGLFIPQQVDYVRWLGDIFLRALKLIIVPLILTSIISGVTNLGGGQNLGRLGLKTISYYVLTSFFAILAGLVLVNIIKPGIGADLGLKMDVPELAAISGGIGDIGMRIIPTNIFSALVEADMLAIIFFSILFGYFITKVEGKYSIFMIDLFNSGFEVMMKLTSFIIKFAPLGILGIVAGVVADQAADKSKLLSMIRTSWNVYAYGDSQD